MSSKKSPNSKPQPFEKVTTPLTKKQIMINNLLGGLFWALGATLGLSLVIALLTIIAHSINFVPIVGTFISHVIDYVLTNNNSLRR